MHLDSLRSIRYHFTALRFIFARARSRSAPNADQAFSTRRRSVDWTGSGVDGCSGKKRGKSLYLRAAGPLVTLRKSRQSRRSRLSERQNEPTRSAGCVARYSGTDCARHFHTFYVNREIWRTGWRMCERDREKKTEITRRSEFARELKADCQVSTHLSSLCVLWFTMVRFNGVLVIVQ